jgi:hypothetical protein
MQKSDVRSAKFGELFETFIDHPDRDEIIAREMGWEFLRKDPNWAENITFDESLDDSFDEAEDADSDASEDMDLDEEFRRDRDELESIEAYSASYRWGLKVHDELQPFCDTDDVQTGDLVVDALACFEVAAKIAGGHGMGYEDEVVCGNIVCCKRAIEAADTSLEALETLKSCAILAADAADRLIAEGKRIRNLVRARIDELRRRVWWT